MTMPQWSRPSSGVSLHPWRRLGRWVPLIVIGLGWAATIGLGLQDYLSLAKIAAHQAELLALVERHQTAAAAGFLALYGLATALSIPGGLWLTVVAGFLFGTWAGAAMVVVGATLGACAVFLAARNAFGADLHRQVAPWLGRFEAGFRDHALSYLLALRLVPLFPFWLINLVPAFLGVSLGTYAAATFFGIIPGTVVFASIGAGLGAVLARGQQPDLSLIYAPEVLLPILGLAALALVPVLFGRRLSAAPEDRS